MLKPSFWLFVGCWLCHELAAQDPIRLQYLPQHTVTQVNKVQIERNDALPGYKVDGEAIQSLTAEITLPGTELANSQLPLDVIVVLKDTHASVNANDLEISIRPHDSQSALSLSQCHLLLDKPLRLHVDGEGVVVVDVNSSKRLFSELPALHGIPLESFWTEWFHPLFALAGKDLVVGKTYDIETYQGNIPRVMHYTVTSIDSQEIQAQYQGRIEPRQHVLHKKQQECELSVSGNVQGKVTWNRANALMCKYEAHYDYTGILNIGDASWTLGVMLTQRLESR